MSATATKQQPKRKASTGKPTGPREGSVMWAIIQVLDGKRTPMTPAEILAEIKTRKLATKLDGKTPEASVAARLAVHAAKGLYVERPEKGKYRLKPGVTAKSVASGSGSKQAPQSRGARTASPKRARAKTASKAGDDKTMPSQRATQPAETPEPATA